MENKIRDVYSVADFYEKIVADYESGGTGFRDWKAHRAEMTALLNDIRATFPMVAIEQRWTERRSPGRELTWMIAAPEECARMVDGMPMFTQWPDEERTFYTDDGWHRAFEKWLEFRGWYLERYDEFWFEPTRLPTQDERKQRAEEARIREFALQGPPVPAHLVPCPF